MHAPISSRAGVEAHGCNRTPQLGLPRYPLGQRPVPFAGSVHASGHFRFLVRAETAVSFPRRNGRMTYRMAATKPTGPDHSTADSNSGPKQDSAQLAAGKAQVAKAFQGYKKSFPQVEDVSPTELHDLQQAGTEFTLLDVREADEQQVSMLEGAVPKASFESTLPQQDKDQLIVTYCTAGLRSGKYAQKLQGRGYRVKNLSGSLVSWAHEGLPMIDPTGQPVNRFHAFGQQWADMAEGSGYETVVHQLPLLKGAGDALKSAWPFG